MRHVSKRYTAIVQIGEPHDMTKLSLLQICEELHVGIAFKVAKKVWVECLQVLRHLHGEVRGCNITGGCNDAGRHFVDITVLTRLWIVL